MVSGYVKVEVLNKKTDNPETDVQLIIVKLISYSVV